MAESETKEINTLCFVCLHSQMVEMSVPQTRATGVMGKNGQPQIERVMQPVVQFACIKAKAFINAGVVVTRCSGFEQGDPKVLFPETDLSLPHEVPDRKM